MKKIFEEIMAERKRQDEKFGEQNHPMIGMSILTWNENEFPCKEILNNQLNQTRERILSGKHGWFDILLEEFCEAFIETEPEKQRAEMIQVAAVAVAIIECIDRKTKSKEAGA